MKFLNRVLVQIILMVAPVRERGLKLSLSQLRGESRLVAPVRERGLKFNILCLGLYLRSGRSRKGAWIEIATIEYCSTIPVYYHVFIVQR